MSIFTENLEQYMLASPNPFYFYRLEKKQLFSTSEILGYDNRPAPQNIIGKAFYQKLVANLAAILRGEQQEFDYPSEFRLDLNFIRQVGQLQPTLAEYLCLYRTIYEDRKVGYNTDNLAMFIESAPTQVHAVHIFRHGEAIFKPGSKSIYNIDHTGNFHQGPTINRHLFHLGLGLEKHNIINELFIDSVKDYLKNSTGTEHITPDDLRGFVASHTENHDLALQKILPEQYETTLYPEGMYQVNDYPCASLRVNCWDMVGIKEEQFHGIALAEGYIEQLTTWLQNYLPELGLSVLECKEGLQNHRTLWCQSDSECLPRTLLLKEIIETFRHYSSFIMSPRMHTHEAEERKNNLLSIIRHHELDSGLQTKPSTKENKIKI